MEHILHYVIAGIEYESSLVVLCVWDVDGVEDWLLMASRDALGALKIEP